MEVYGLLASGGIYDWPVIKQISWILGQVMKWNLQCNERDRDRKYWCKYHHIYDHCIHNTPSAYDQAAEILENDCRDEP